VSNSKFGAAPATDDSDHPFTAVRRQRYAAAEAVSPKAREPELTTFSRYLPDGGGQALLELGSGNGTLTRHLMARDWVVDTTDVAFSPIDGARRHYAQNLTEGLPPLVIDAPYGAVASLATLHHVAEQSDRLPDRLVRGIASVTAPGATVVLQDVPSPVAARRRTDEAGAREAQATARFFTGVVDRLSRPQHSGNYLEMDRIADQLGGHGFEPVFVGWHACSWQFADYPELAAFVTSLFNLEVKRGQLDGLLDGQWRPTEDGVELLWALDCLVMRKRP